MFPFPNDIDKQTPYSLLLGNGFLKYLTHNTPANIPFRISENLSFEKIYNDVKAQVIQAYGEHYCGKVDFKCPEKLLNTFRVELSYAILMAYYSKTQSYKNLHDFPGVDILQNSENMFTLNYDPITYKQLFENRNEHNDGILYNRKERFGYPLTKIKRVIGADGKGIYYVHGAFHIMHYQNDEDPFDLYYKSSTKLDEEEITEDYDRIIDSFRKGQKEKNNITCVIEGRSNNKLIWIKRDPYLNFCFKKLAEQKQLITFGCSFSNDDHILEALLLSNTLEKLYIGIYNQEDIDNVHKALGRIKRNHKICEISNEDLQNKLGKMNFFNTSDDKDLDNAAMKKWDEL